MESHSSWSLRVFFYSSHRYVEYKIQQPKTIRRKTICWYRSTVLESRFSVRKRSVCQTARSLFIEICLASQALDEELSSTEYVLTMFRNVTGAQEAVVHRQSEDSLTHDKPSVKVIKDVQSDNIARTYVALKSKWFRERQHLAEQLKHLETHRGFPPEIQRVKNTIECLNTLIDNGELSKHCQTLVDQMTTSIQPTPESYALTRKPLGEKMIRLPRHVSMTALDISTTVKEMSSEAIREQVRIQQRSPSELRDPTSSATTVSQNKVQSGIQFYVVAEQFRTPVTNPDHQIDKTRKPRRTHYLSSMMEWHLG